MITKIRPDKRIFMQISGGPKTDPTIMDLVAMDKRIYKGVRMKVYDDGKTISVWLNKKDFTKRGHRLM